LRAGRSARTLLASSVHATTNNSSRASANSGNSNIVNSGIAMRVIMGRALFEQQTLLAGRVRQRG
jgi:hypothetical protein